MNNMSATVCKKKTILTVFDICILLLNSFKRAKNLIVSTFSLIVNIREISRLINHLNRNLNRGILAYPFCRTQCVFVNKTKISKN